MNTSRRVPFSSLTSIVLLVPVLALIAMVDPEMETSASTELGAAVVVSTPVVLGGIAITTLAATGTLSLISTIAVLAALVGAAGAVQWWIVRRLTQPG